jgi:hypothetical protein
MRHIRILEVSFDTEIQPYQLPQFRGAIARKAGLEHDLFHNHNNDNGGFHNRYPLIQYKLDTHKGQMRPMLLCLEDGIEEAHHFFSQPDWSVNLNGDRHTLRVARLHVNKYLLNTWQRQFGYRLHKWQALNPDAYKEYRQIESLAGRLIYLERKLQAHINSFASSVDWKFIDPLSLSITDMVKTEWLEFKKIKVLTFTLDFKCNVSLPDFIGLGKGSSMGLGVVRRQKVV